MKIILKNEQGLSLIEVMVVVGLLGGLALFLMNLMEQQSRVSQTARIESEVNSIRAALSRMTNNKGSCDRNFQGRMKGDDVTQLVYGSDWQNQQPFLQVGQEFGNTGLEVRGIRILNRAEEAVGQPCPGTGFIDPLTTEGIVCLRVTLGSLRQIYGAQEKIIHFPVDVRFGNPFFITSSGTQPHEECRAQKAAVPGVGANGLSRMICDADQETQIMIGGIASNMGVCIINRPAADIDLDAIMECVGLDRTDRSFTLSGDGAPCP